MSQIKSFCQNQIGPFVIQTTFEIFEEGKTYKLRSIEENLEIEPKTIIINESKLSIPKLIKNFSLIPNIVKNHWQEL